MPDRAAVAPSGIGPIASRPMLLGAGSASARPSDGSRASPLSWMPCPFRWA